tara:strand:- start:271 stop:402 length:132 start_codon:yes stop_codon:yes gene_type:complete
MITNALNLKILAMCEKVLPNTTMKNNKQLIDLLSEVRTQLEGK